MPRTDTASTPINAAPASIYEAFVSADAVAAWLPPDGMSGHIEVFEPKPAGRFRMTLTYGPEDHDAAGKTTENSDTVEGRFVELVPTRRIVQDLEFVSADPAFAGTMRMIWTIEPQGKDSHVTVLCQNVPDGIRQDDHLRGLTASLDNLRRYVETGMKP